MRPRLGSAGGVRVVAASLVAAALAGATPALAEVVELVAEGEVFSLTDEHGVLDPSVALGVPMRATIAYDTDVEDVIDADPGFGLYPQTVPPARLRIEVGIYTIDVPDAFTASVLNDGSFSDGLTLRREGSALPLAGEPGVVLNLLGLALEDPSKTALDSDALPPAAPSLAEFPTAQIDVTGCLEAESSGAFCEPGETLAVRALVTSLPEPGAASLAACVTLAILARTRGRLATPRAGAAADTPR